MQSIEVMTTKARTSPLCAEDCSMYRPDDIVIAREKVKAAQLYSSAVHYFKLNCSGHELDSNSRELIATIESLLRDALRVLTALAPRDDPDLVEALGLIEFVRLNKSNIQNT